MFAWLFIGGLACTQTETQSTQTESEGDSEFVVEPLQAGDQALPAAVVGEEYEVALAWSGGEGEVQWSSGDPDAIPPGLDLKRDGRVSGRPSQAGSFEFVAEVFDQAGEYRVVTLSISVDLEPTVLQCGDSVSGEFAGGAVIAGNVDFNALDSLAWLAVEVPNGGVQRVALDVQVSRAATLFVQHPDQPLGSWELRKHYVDHGVPGGESSIPVDGRTYPSLPDYGASDYIPLLLASDRASGSWELSVTCTDGPVLQQAAFSAPLGAAFDADLEVFGSNEGVRFTTQDTLPDWLSLDEATGVLTGMPPSEDVWEVSVTVTAPDLREREEQVVLGAYEVTDIQCGELVSVQTQRGTQDSPLLPDPFAYRVVRLPVGSELSALEAVLTSDDAAFMYATSDGLEVHNFADPGSVDEPRTLTIDQHTVHRMLDYQAAGAVQVWVAASEGPVDAELLVTCDTGPRPAFGALPVPEEGIAGSFALEAYGGEAPYTVSIADLPPGLSVLDNALTGTAAEAGEYPVEVTVEDATGATHTSTYPLFVGLQSVDPTADLVACGDTVESDFSSAGEVTTLMTRNEGGPFALDITTQTAEVHPGVHAPTSLRRYVFLGDRIPAESSATVWLDDDSVTPLRSYPSDTAVRFHIEAVSPGTWEATLRCPQ